MFPFTNSDTNILTAVQKIDSRIISFSERGMQYWDYLLYRIICSVSNISGKTNIDSNKKLLKTKTMLCCLYMAAESEGRTVSRSTIQVLQTSTHIEYS